MNTLNGAIKEALQIYYGRKNVRVRVWEAAINFKDITIYIYNTSDGESVIESHIRPLLQNWCGDNFSLTTYSNVGNPPEIDYSTGHKIKGSRLIW